MVDKQFARSLSFLALGFWLDMVGPGSGNTAVAGACSKYSRVDEIVLFSLFVYFAVTHEIHVPVNLNIEAYN